MTRDAWLDAHPWLRPVALFSGQVDAALASVAIEGAPVPRWDDYAGDYLAGVPLLQCAEAAPDLEPAGGSVVELVERLAVGALSGKLAAEARELAAQLRRAPDAPRRVASWLLGDDALAPSSPGLLRYLGWTVTARYLAPVVGAFDRWRDEERWMRRYCPTCGAAPAMAWLQGVDPGRLRLLACGRCGTRWRYKRTECPFCEHDSQRLAIVAVEGEALRIDHCESCRGYVKTYAGQGDEAFYLADWTSLHLDLIAQERGLERLAASLYDLEPVLLR